ncbi:MAG: hypothetical protein C4522_04390 [Desulfobacteraceae bacterium]|nr:MAG: hypothetical protein C4522_04390 [Desulfobacteraceae bacterium]
MVFNLSEYSMIPGHVPASGKPDYFQKIPKVIRQTMKSNHVPSIMKDFSDSWMENNPEYEYRFYDDDAVVNFIRSDFPQFLKGYQKIRYGASRADLWRYLVIYQFGGVYADLDCRCLFPLRTWINPDSEYVTQLGVNHDICQWLIISVPKNPIFLRAAEKSIQNIENNRTYCEYRGFESRDRKIEIRNAPLIKVSDHVMGLAGPPILQAAAEECLADGSLDGILPFTQVVCSSRGKSCQMNGNVLHDHGHPAYRKALKTLKTPHYTHGRHLARIIGRLRSFGKNKAVPDGRATRPGYAGKKNRKP